MKGFSVSCFYAKKTFRFHGGCMCCTNLKSVIVRGCWIILFQNQVPMSVCFLFIYGNMFVNCIELLSIICYVRIILKTFVNQVDCYICLNELNICMMCIIFWPIGLFQYQVFFRNATTFQRGHLPYKPRSWCILVHAPMSP